MRSFVAAALAVVAACGHKESASNAPPSPKPIPIDAAAMVAGDAAVAVEPKPHSQAADEVVPGYDFTPIGRVLLAVCACGDGPIPEDYPLAVVESHCKAIKQTQQQYIDSWLEIARPWLAERVPKDIPKKVVYPFAGGDLSTALAVYPDADEITTISLEPAGDPRTLDALNHPQPDAGKSKAPAKAAKPTAALAKGLGTIQSELKFLYHVNFSNTMNMIDAMRGGLLPTQLVFGLSALKVHGYEVVSLRYFKLDATGGIQYLTGDDVKKAPPVAGGGNPDLRNRVFANAELRFRKPGGRVQIYRHIQFNLDDDHMKKDGRLLEHLEAKGDIAGMTKAASYLLSFDSFKITRDYLLRHVVWMVSDATGVAPKWGKPAGYEYETYGQFLGPHMNAGKSISKNWEAEFTAQTKRALPFRFGYYDTKLKSTLVMMRRAPPPK